MVILLFATKQVTMTMTTTTMMMMMMMLMTMMMDQELVEAAGYALDRRSVSINYIAALGDGATSTTRVMSTTKCSFCNNCRRNARIFQSL